MKYTNKRFLLICLLFLLFQYSELMGQDNKSFNIRVMDENEVAVSGAKISLLANPDISYSTDNKGFAEINVNDDQLVLITFNNMQKTALLSDSLVIVRFSEKDRKIKVGFNIEKSMAEISSSVEVIHEKDLKKYSVLNPEESLYGQFAGLAVLQNTPEDSPDLFIRGQATYNNSSINVLVDGVKTYLSSLDIDEIESITLLKDASALSMYGLSGANGVLLVNTKRGIYNTFQTNVNVEQSITRPFRLPEFLNAHDYANAINEARALDGYSKIYSDWDIEDYKSGNNPYYFPNVNWFDEAFNEYGTNSKYNINFRGGGSNARFFALLSYQNESGLLRNPYPDDRYDSQLKNDRLLFRTNIDVDLTKSTKLQVNLSGSMTERSGPRTQVSNIMSALYSVPSAAFPVKYEDNIWGGTEYYSNNPIALISSTGQRKTHQTELNTQANLIQDLSTFIKGLSGELMVAYSNSPTFSEIFSKDFIYRSTNVSRNPLTGDIIDSTTIDYGNETDLEFNHSLGWQRRAFANRAKLNFHRNFKTGSLSSSLIYNQDMLIYKGQNNTYLSQGLSGFAAYNFNNKFLLDFSFAYHGNSLMEKGNRFGFFPAVSGAYYVVNKEIAQNHVLSMLKLRASWGLNGNGSMAHNLYEQSYSRSGNYIFTDNLVNYNIVKENKLEVENLTYEEANKTNLGIDLSFFGKADLRIDAFYELRSNILTSTEGVNSNVLGVTPGDKNVGKVLNKGIESSLLINNRKGNLNYFFGGHFTFVRNEILEMNEVYRPYDYLNRTGLPIGQQFGLEVLGFFSNEEDILNSPKHSFSNVRPGDIKYKDQNADGKVDEFDVVPIGYSSSNPEIYYSASMGLEYKHFGMNAMLQGLANQTLYLSTKSVFFPLRNQNTISTIHSDRWTPETAETASLPRLTTLDNDNNYRKNDIWLTGGDFLKLRNVEIYYKLHKSMMNRVKLKSGRIFIRGMNLFSIDAINVVDPEETGAVYPTLTSFHIGIKAGF